MSVAPRALWRTKQTTLLATRLLATIPSSQSMPIAAPQPPSPSSPSPPLNTCPTNGASQQQQARLPTPGDCPPLSSSRSPSLDHSGTEPLSRSSSPAEQVLPAADSQPIAVSTRDGLFAGLVPSLEAVKPATRSSSASVNKAKKPSPPKSLTRSRAVKQVLGQAPAAPRKQRQPRQSTKANLAPPVQVPVQQPQDTAPMVVDDTPFDTTVHPAMLEAMHLRWLQSQVVQGLQQQQQYDVELDHDADANEAAEALVIVSCHDWIMEQQAAFNPGQCTFAGHHHHYPAVAAAADQPHQTAPQQYRYIYHDRAQDGQNSFPLFQHHRPIFYTL